jgi:DNA polymerase-1
MALTGDPTDNIPGIEGVGDKTAGKLVTANGSLENLLNNIDNLKNLNRKGEVVEASDTLKQKIKSNIDNIKLAYKLAKINTGLDFEPEFERKEINIEGVRNKFKELEFESFLNEFDSWEKSFRSW